MPKSPDAFRTISEVADWLGVQAHVLRFWESKFTQVKPIKRAGGRRYYRPADMQLLGGLKKVLHEDGLTIKGAQKLLREQGVAHVAAMSPPLDDLTTAEIDADKVAATPAMSDATPQSGPEPAPEHDAGTDAEAADHSSDMPGHEPAEVAVADGSDDAGDTGGEAEVTDGDAGEDAPETIAADADGAPADEDVVAAQGAVTEDAAEQDDADEGIDDAPALPGFITSPLSGPAAADDTEQPDATAILADAEPDDDDEADAPDPETSAAEATDTAGTFEITPPDTPREPVRPAQVDVPPVPDEADIEVSPSALTALSRIKQLDSDQADKLRPLLQQLTALRAGLSGPGKEAGKD